MKQKSSSPSLAEVSSHNMHKAYTQFPKANLFLTAALLILAAGCSKNENAKTLSEQEYNYPEKLSAIASDNNGFWLGSETGVIWHVSGDNRRRYDTGLDRIYDIVRDQADTTHLWIASRNAGLQDYRISNDSLTPLSIYPIPGKGNRYSPYDIALTAHHAFIATSQGLYTMPLAKGGADSRQLRRIFPNKPQYQEGHPFPVNSLCADGNYLYAATQEGMVDFSLSDTTSIPSAHYTHPRQRYRGKAIQQVSVYGNRLYILSDRQVTIETIGTSQVEQHDLPLPALTFYKVGHTHYFICPGCVCLTDDFDNYTTVPLNHGIPANSHNPTLADDGNGFSLMLTDNAVLHIPHHLGVFNGDTPIAAACTDGSQHYYLNNREDLFRQPANSRKAVKIYAFPPDKAPQGIGVVGNQLYFYDATNRLFSLKMGNSYLTSQLTARPRPVYQAATRITAMTALPARHQVLLGVQDYLVSIDTDTGLADTISSMQGKYITAFHCPPGSNDIYIATLNHGTFCLSGSELHPMAGTSNHPFQQDLFVDNNYDRHLFLLTNHRLLALGTDSLSVSGNRRLLRVNDSIIYTIPEAGIHKYILRANRLVDAGIRYADIKFNPRAAFVSGNRAFLGSDLGVAVLTPQHEGRLDWIVLDASVPSLTTIAVITAYVISVLGLLYLSARLRRRSERHQLRASTDDLRHRAKGLNSMLAQLDGDQGDAIREINAEIDAIDIKSPNVKTANKRIKDISNRIMRLNSDAALLLVKVIDRQIADIRRTDLYERAELTRASESARDSDDVDRIIQQISRNTLWLNHVDELTERIDKFSRATEGTLVLPGINETMTTRLSQLHEARMHKPLADIYTDFTAIKSQYECLFSPEALTAIQTYISRAHEQLQQERHYPYTATSLRAELDLLYKDREVRDRIVLLRALRRIDDRIHQMNLLHAIRRLMREYTSVHDDVLHENESRRMRKFETKLFDEISTATRHITSELASLIDQFYTSIAATDSDIIEGTLHFTGSANQSVRVLVLLMADPKVKRTLLPGMIGVYGNLNPVISRLYHGKIGDNKTLIAAWCERNPDSIIYYLLKLIE